MTVTNGLNIETYLEYNVYQSLLEEFNIDYIPAIKIIRNPSYEQLIACLDINNYLIKDGEGKGEGIVIKNYDFRNKYGRTTWAKIITSEFKEKHVRTMGAPQAKGPDLVEERIVEKFCTKALVEKVHAKIVTENGGWSSKYIPRLLNVVYYDIINEEAWNIVKDFKRPTVNFKTLFTLVTIRIKEYKSELF